MPETQLEIVQRAESLAAGLDGGPTKVGKNVLLALVADFMSTPRPDRDRLRRLLELVTQDSGGHTSRGGGYGDQIRLAADEVAGVLAEDLDDRELKCLFGWTARLLLSRQERAPARPPERAAALTAPPPRRRREEEPPPPPRKAPVVPKSGKIWDDALAGWQQGSLSFSRGKEVAVCPPEAEPAELRAALKTLKKKTELRAKVEVVKSLGGLRVVRVLEWRTVEK